MNARVIRSFILALLVAALAALLGIYKVWQEHRRVELGARLAAKLIELEALQRENELLEAEYRTLRSARHRETKRFREMGMGRPSARNTIMVKSQVKEKAK